MKVHEDRWLTVYAGDNREVMRGIEPESVHAVVTSPPYWGLRDYGLPPSTWADGWEGCLGLEPTPDVPDPADRAHDPRRCSRG